MKLGDKIRSAREALGLNQSDLAERLSVEPATVSRWETGALRPRVKKLKSIAEMLEKPIEWFQEPTISAGEFEARLAALEESALRNTVIPYRPNIPQEVIDNWEKADSIRQAICLYLLTREDRYAQRLGHETVSRLEAIFRMTPHENQRKKKTP